MGWKMSIREFTSNIIKYRVATRKHDVQYFIVENLGICAKFWFSLR